MFDLIGSRTNYDYGYGGYTGTTTDEEEVVATFDTKKAARRYIKKSELKSPKDRHFPFRQKSLLSYYEYAHIEEHVDDPPPPPPHNPEL